jgi:predicted nucleic-acid-binding protein
MIGLDTNILVRYLTQDDPIQSAAATEIVEQRLSKQNPGLVSIVAMVETVWVLSRAYRFTAQEVAVAIELMLRTDALVIQDEQLVFTAMVALRDGHGSFSDALLSALGKAAGCPHTLTFDRRALKLPGFQLA